MDKYPWDFCLLGWVGYVELEEIIMMSSLSTAKWKIVLALDLALGVLLCFGFLTGYSWNNNWASLIFPPAVGVIGVIILIFKKKVIVFKKWVDAVFYVPSLLLGVPSILSIVELIAGSLFFMTNRLIEEKVGGEIIQKELAPDSKKVAQVECFPASAHNGHWIEIGIVYQAAPFVKQGLRQYWEMAPCEKIDDSNYLSWLDNDTIYFSKTNEEIEVTSFGWNNLFTSSLEK